MPNSGPNINVLAKFQPMLKRFMVWDKELGKFLKYNGEEIYDLPLLTDLLYIYNVEIHEDLNIIQSTNLFDKNDKEIFEGSIVEFEGNKHVVKHINGCYIIDNSKLGITETGWCFDHIKLWKKDKLNMKVIGHILSNPELLKER